VALDEDSDLGSLEELTLLLGCIPSAIKSFIKSYEVQKETLNTANACRRLLNSSFSMDFWQQSPMASSPVVIKIFDSLKTAPPEMDRLVLLLGLFSKRIPLDPALLLACQALCDTEPEELYSGITRGSTGRINQLDRKIQNLLTVIDMSLVEQYAEFISLLLSCGLVQFDGPDIDHLSPQQDMKGPDGFFGTWIYIHPLLTDYLRCRARVIGLGCIREYLQNSFILYCEVLIMLPQYANNSFLRLFVSENLLNFVTCSSMPLKSMTTFTRVSAYIMEYVASLLVTHRKKHKRKTIRLHSGMIELVMQGVCKDFASSRIPWTMEYNPNPFQQRIALMAVVETALGLCSIYVRDCNWPQLNRFVEVANDIICVKNQPFGEDLSALSSRVNVFLDLEDSASLALHGPKQEIKGCSEVFDLSSIILTLSRQIRGMDLKISNEAMQADFLFRSRKLAASSVRYGGQESNSTSRFRTIPILTSPDKEEAINMIENNTRDLWSVLNWRTELAIILCNEGNYWEAVDELVHLLTAIMNRRLAVYCQPSRENACFVDQIAFVFYLYGHVAMCLCGTRNKQFAQLMFSACSQLCIGGYSWTERVLRLSCLDIICSSGCATEEPLWKECIRFLDLFYSEPVTTRRLGARSLDGRRRYGEDFDGAKKYLLFGCKPRQAVYFLERRLFTRYEGAHTKIDLNDDDGKANFVSLGSLLPPRAGLFFMIIFTSLGGVDYNVGSNDSVYGVLAQDHLVKRYLTEMLGIEEEQLWEYLCIVSTFVLAILLVNNSEPVEAYKDAISALAAEAEVVMFGNKELLHEYHCVHYFKNTREGEHVGSLSILCISQLWLMFAVTIGPSNGCAYLL